MNFFEEAKRAMEEISQEADFFEKAKKKKSRLSEVCMANCHFAIKICPNTKAFRKFYHPILGRFWGGKSGNLGSILFRANLGLQKYLFGQTSEDIINSSDSINYDLCG